LAGEDGRRYFAQAFGIPFSPDPDDIGNYVEKRLDMDAEPKARTNDLQLDIVGAIQEKISDMCVGPFSTFTLLIIYTY